MRYRELNGPLSSISYCSARYLNLEKQRAEKVVLLLELIIAVPMNMRLALVGGSKTRLNPDNC